MSIVWTEQRYNQLCEACDSVLLSKGANLNTIAIPWLHVVRPHHVFLKEYDKLFIDKLQVKDYINQLRSELRRFISWHLYLREAFTKNGAWWHAKPLPDSVDILFISHLINKSHTGISNDFYFGDLPQSLCKRGITSSIALINHVSDLGISDLEYWQNAEIPRIVLSRSLSFPEELHIRRCLMSESFRLTKTLESVASFKTSVVKEAARQARSSGSIANLRFLAQVRLLVQTLRPKAIVTTFEGHAWERIAFAAARSVDPGILCLGYQHAAIFKLHHAIHRDIGSEYDPDIFLSTGSTPALQLRAQKSYKCKPIIVLGSVRAFTDNNESSFTRNDCVLVIPDGTISECLLMFKFAFKAADAFPDIKFTWRLHPLINREYLERIEPLFRTLPVNVSWSDLSLERDALNSRWALYRGSTAIITASCAGCLPIYLSVLGEISIDPLADIDMLRPSIYTVDSLADIFNSKCNSELIDNIKIYCCNYFAPLNENSLLEGLSVLSSQFVNQSNRRHTRDCK